MPVMQELRKIWQCSRSGMLTFMATLASEEVPVLSKAGADVLDAKGKPGQLRIKLLGMVEHMADD